MCVCVYVCANVCYISSYLYSVGGCTVVFVVLVSVSAALKNVLEELNLSNMLTFLNIS